MSASGIGELNERSLHRALKNRYAVPGSRVEQTIDRYVADVVIGNRIVEIHTGVFSGIKAKLAHLLDDFAVTLVHPIALDRYIVKLPDADGASASRRKSPKHGSVFYVFGALVGMPRLLAHPNLTLDILLTVEEEIRVADPGRRRRRRGWRSIDRRLVEVAETHRITVMADLFAMLDAHLPETFTTRDLAAAMKVPRRLGQQAAYCFREAGVAEVCGKERNALVYRRSERRGFQGAASDIGRQPG